MFSYYLKLAVLALKRNRNLSILMIAAIAMGIGASMTAMTVLHGYSSNPIPQRNDVLHAVQLDSWSPDRPYEDDGRAPDQMSYKDAIALLERAPAAKQIAMYKLGLAVQPTRAELLPSNHLMRATGHAFFSMFDVPFKSGGPWTAADDAAKARVTVLSEELAKSLFGDEDAVGKQVSLGDEQYRITGVISPWRPQPKFYDLTNGALNAAEAAFIPFSVAIDKQESSAGNNNCFNAPPGPGWDGYLASDCIWLQFWAELPDEAARAAYLDFLDAYADEQNKLGRFPRTRNNHIHRVDEWLVNQEVVPQDNKIFVGVGFAFLLVCLINAVGLMLAKFLRRTGELAVRRALGASRKSLFAQHLIEAGLVGALGGVFGLLLTWAGLLGVRSLSPGLSHIAVLDSGMLALLLVLAVGACRVMPAANLKSN
jgi:putative ABC transport system permease protein